MSDSSGVFRIRYSDMMLKQNTDKQPEVFVCKDVRSRFDNFPKVVKSVAGNFCVQRCPQFPDFGTLIRVMYERLPMIRYIFAGKVFLLMAIVQLGLYAWAAAEELSGAEYRVKAGFIYHFARFTQWPADTFASEESPLVLCVAAEQGADILQSLHSKMIRKRPIAVQQYTESENTAPVCHILFVADSAEDRFPAMPPGPVLTIGETEAFGKKGGIIRFFTEKDRLRFAVNLKAARNAGLQLSSQLLMSAEIATEAP